MSALLCNALVSSLVKESPEQALVCVIYHCCGGVTHQDIVEEWFPAIEEGEELDPQDEDTIERIFGKHLNEIKRMLQTRRHEKKGNTLPDGRD